MEERWVCQRCFNSNGAIWDRCSNCGLDRGEAPAPEEQAAAMPQTTRGRGLLGTLLRQFWVIPVVAIVAFVGYLGSAQRDDTGEVSRGGSLSIEDLRIGDCFDVGELDEVAEVDAKPCAEPHEYELFHIATWQGEDAYPTQTDMERFIDAECLPAFERFVAAPYATSRYDILWFSPVESGWREGDRVFQCAIYDPREPQLTSSVRGSGR